MSKTKFTPGPWELDNFFSLTDKQGKTITISCGIAITGRTKYGIEETANSHLIAAAPELYDALEFFASLNLQSYNWLEPHILKAKDAILKAQGGGQ